MELASHLVAVFDPARPQAPRVELVANFDPRKHVRWDHRPHVIPLDLPAIPGHDEGSAMLTAAEAEALATHGVNTLKDVLAAGPQGLEAAGLSKRKARELSDWARGRHAAAYAIAEIEAERAAAPTATETQEAERMTEQPTGETLAGEAPTATGAPAEPAEGTKGG